MAESSGHDHRRLVCVVAGGFLIRLVLILVGTIIDGLPFRLKYTDIDYTIVSDAGKLMANGRSPFERATYRYSPLFAFLLLPDALLGSSTIGKVVFSACDVALGVSMASIGRRRGLDASRVAALWLFNPIAIGICTRGSSDAVVAAAVCAALDLNERRRPAWAGACLGLGAHVKLYPIIHLPAFYKNPRCIATALVVFASTTSLAACTYEDYAREALFYHVHRVDFRHNFSPFWLPFFLSLDKPHQLLLALGPFSLHAVSQAATLLLLRRADLVTCVFAQTLLFVATNKVCTAQYFVWWLPFALLASAHCDYRLLLRPALVWFVALGAWLAVAYALEFLGWSVHLLLWIHSLLFFAANINLLVAILKLSSSKRRD